MLIILSFILMIFGEYCIVSINDFGAIYKRLHISGKKVQIQDIPREEELQYPRYNKEIVQKVLGLWEEYYACLEQKANVEKKLEIVRPLEGQNIELNCDICPKPFQNYDELEWKYKPLFPSAIAEPEQLDLTNEMVLTSDKTLKIYNVIEDLSGLYVCYHSKSAVSGYILEVSRNDTIEKVDTTFFEPKTIFNTEDTSLKVYYNWGSWTECSSCGSVGRKFKYGFCFVVTDKANNGKTTLEPEETTTGTFLKELLKSKFLKRKGSTPSSNNLREAVNLIAKFETGMPCTSSYLPHFVLDSAQKFKAIKAVVKHCLVSCGDSEIFEVLDPLGNLIEASNNSAGIYSMFQKLPQLPPEIERRTLPAEFGKDITFPCPGTLLTNTPVTWKINQKLILPQVIANESKGRFTIDLVNRIHIKRLRLRDSRIYSCWQRGKLAGTVNLIVEKKFKIGFDHHVTLIGLTLIVGTFLLVGVKILKRELEMRKK